MIDLKRVKRQVAWQHQRARAAGVESTLTEGEWLDIITSCAGKCFYCLKSVGENGLMIDHKKSITKQGANAKENVVAACFRCNSRKGNRTSPDVETMLANRIGEDEVLVKIGGHKIRMFDREIEALIGVLKRALLEPEQG